MKLLKNLELTPQKIMSVIITIVIASIILITGYHFGMELITGIPTEQEWVEEDVSFENIVSEEEPSLNMMLSHLKEISKERHTTNSDEIHAVREYLCEQFEIMGYEYEIIEDSYEGTELAVLDLQHYWGISKEDAVAEKERKSGGFKHYYSEHYRENYEEEEILPVKHLLVKVVPENVSNEKAVLVMSHFDGVSSSTNTTDAGMSVASILEAMRLLKNVELFRPVYFWFSDGEEVSLLGAETLLDDMPELTDNVEYVLNFSGYGPEGNQFLICTGENNRVMLDYFKNSNSKIAAFSLFSKGFDKWGIDEYRNVLKPAGFQGLDFASVIDSKEFHYTMHDSVENLDRDYANSTLYNITTLIQYCATTNLHATDTSTVADTKESSSDTGRNSATNGVTSNSDTLIFTLPFFKYVTVPAKQIQMIHLIIIVAITLLVLLLQKVTNDVKPETTLSEFLTYIGGGLLVIILSAYVFDRTIFLGIDWSIRGYFLIPITYTALFIFTKAIQYKMGEIGTFWCLFILLGVSSVLTTLCVPDVSYPFVAAFIVLNVIELFNAYTKGIIHTILVLLATIFGGILIVSLFATWQVIAYATVGASLFGALFLILMPSFCVIYYGTDAAIRSIIKTEFNPTTKTTSPEE